MTDKALMKRTADNVRILAATMVEKAKSGHPGGAMGGADFVSVLYFKHLLQDPDNPSWFVRDRFFLDPGHMSPMLYSILYLTGRYSASEIQQFRSWGSVTPGHPELDVAHGVENTSGPLGQGHVMAVGCAIAERFIAARFGELFAHKTYAFISDGGVQEGISQEAARIAGCLGLHNLIMFYDSNSVQLSTNCDAVSNEDTAMKYRAWNWNVIEIDGNDPDAIDKALTEAKAEKERPTIIIGNTIMGYGCVTADGANFEGQCSTHGNPLSKSGADYAKTIENLGGNVENPWAVFPEVSQLARDYKAAMRYAADQRKAKIAKWRKENPEKAQELDRYIKGELPAIDYAAIAHKPNIATRASSADVLGELAKKVGNMIVSSADLANSDKTDGFLKQTTAFKRGDFSGAFLHAGVSELAMAAIINGIALHGGVIGACGTFFVFSDYMKPAARIAALMELPVKYVWTHDAFRVGEDGPTHEPVEQEAQIRLMEELKNHSGRNSMLVLRPADSAETTVAWKMAMENMHTPTALILSRQNVNDLPAMNGEGYAARFNEALQAEKGAYIIYKDDAPDVVLVGNGSEVGTLLAAATLLKERGVKSQIVSAPSIGVFMNQDKAYRDQVIPSNLKAFGLTAGLPSTLMRLIPNGKVYGLDHFGASAPYGVLDEKFGFTPENIASEIEKWVKS
ncbi:MAG: transketolase [Muribaculaceae bacterium]|nr:transketolase [Muribaculaceae bacterium]MBQ3961286.1 transketolase [Muribaculaceae bacterium]